MKIQHLQILRLLTRKAFSDAIVAEAVVRRRNGNVKEINEALEDVTTLAAIHEEVCGLLEKTSVFLTLCHLLEDNPRDAAHMRDAIIMMGAILNVAHPAVFDFKTAAASGWVKPKRPLRRRSVGKLHRQ